MNRLLAKAIDAWHDPLRALGFPERERHQGSPVNYHHRVRANGYVAERPIVDVQTLPPMPAIPAAVESPVPEIPAWEDPPYWPDGTLLEACLDCNGGLVETIRGTTLCPNCKGMLFKEHAHEND